ncbi:hypothetical protein STEG23_014379 [Scotinomys teguina]
MRKYGMDEYDAFLDRIGYSRQNNLKGERLSVFKCIIVGKIANLGVSWVTRMGECHKGRSEDWEVSVIMTYDVKFLNNR